MAGIRIHHPTARSCKLLVHHQGEIKVNLFKTINRSRSPKDYHIILDNEGNCIVSEKVWQRLQEAQANFIVLNEVPDPPTQYVSNRDTEVFTPAVSPTVTGGVVANVSISDQARTNMLVNRGLVEPRRETNTDLMFLVLEDGGQTLVTETDATAATHLVRYMMSLRS